MSKMYYGWEKADHGEWRYFPTPTIQWSGHAIELDFTDEDRGVYMWDADVDGEYLVSKPNSPEWLPAEVKTIEEAQAWAVATWSMT